MKSICALLGCVLTLGIGLSAFGAEQFNYSTVVKLRSANKFNEIKTYVESATDVAKDFKVQVNHIAARLMVMSIVDKTVTEDNLYTTIDQLVDKYEFTSEQKLAAKVHFYYVGWWFCKFQPPRQKRTDLLKELAKRDDITSLLTTYVDEADVYAVFKFKPDHIKYAAQLINCNLNYFNFVVGDKSISKNDKLVVVKEFANAVSSSNSKFNPTLVNQILRNIERNLTDSIYDEYIKQGLVALNKKCYPKIADNEDWKKVVVKLHLIMKSYGL